MRASLVKRIAVLDAQSIECPIKTGVPDINYNGGWIECKYRDSWPVRPNDIVRFKHPVTPGQKVWMRRRVRRGGRCFLAAKVASEWFFWNVAEFNLDLFNTMDRAAMIGTSTLYFKYRLDDKLLIKMLTGE
jgi:hypothetical protein